MLSRHTASTPITCLFVCYIICFFMCLFSLRVAPEFLLKTDCGHPLDSYFSVFPPFFVVIKPENPYFAPLPGREVKPLDVYPPGLRNYSWQSYQRYITAPAGDALRANWGEHSTILPILFFNLTLEVLFFRTALPAVLPNAHHRPESLYVPTEVNTLRVDGLARISGLTQALGSYADFLNC